MGARTHLTHPRPRHRCGSMARDRAGRGNHANTPRESSSPTDSTDIVVSDAFASDKEKDQEIARLREREKEHEIVIARLRDENARLRDEIEQLQTQASRKRARETDLEPGDELGFEPDFNSLRDKWHRFQTKYRRMHAKLKSQSERVAEQDRMLAERQRAENEGRRRGD